MNEASVDRQLDLLIDRLRRNCVERVERSAVLGSTFAAANELVEQISYACAHLLSVERVELLGYASTLNSYVEQLLDCELKIEHTNYSSNKRTANILKRDRAELRKDIAKHIDRTNAFIADRLAERKHADQLRVNSSWSLLNSQRSELDNEHVELIERLSEALRKGS